MPRPSSPLSFSQWRIPLKKSAAIVAPDLISTGTAAEGREIQQLSGAARTEENEAAEGLEIADLREGPNVPLHRTNPPGWGGSYRLHFENAICTSLLLERRRGVPSDGQRCPGAARH